MWLDLQEPINWMLKWLGSPNMHECEKACNVMASKNLSFRQTPPFSVRQTKNHTLLSIMFFCYMVLYWYKRSTVVKTVSVVTKAQTWSNLVTGKVAVPMKLSSPAQNNICSTKTPRQWKNTRNSKGHPKKISTQASRVRTLLKRLPYPRHTHLYKTQKTFNTKQFNKHHDSHGCDRWHADIITLQPLTRPTHNKITANGLHNKIKQLNISSINRTGYKCYPP